MFTAIKKWVSETVTRRKAERIVRRGVSRYEKTASPRRYTTIKAKEPYWAVSTTVSVFLTTKQGSSYGASLLERKDTRFKSSAEALEYCNAVRGQGIAVSEIRTLDRMLAERIYKELIQDKIDALLKDAPLPDFDRAAQEIMNGDV